MQVINGAPAEQAAWLRQEVVRLSQTDITPDPHERLAHSLGACSFLETHPEVAASDPTLLGESLAKAMLASAHAGASLFRIEELSEQSLDALDRDEPRFRIERVSALFLSVRAITHHALEHGGMRRTRIHDNHAKVIEGEDLLENQYVPGSPWHRYGTMHARVGAVFESLYNSNVLARYLAKQSIIRAKSADPEDKTTEEHEAFIRKQMLGGHAAQMLVATKPLKGVPFVKQARLAIVRRQLG